MWKYFFRKCVTQLYGTWWIPEQKEAKDKSVDTISHGDWALIFIFYCYNVIHVIEKDRFPTIH